MNHYENICKMLKESMRDVEPAYIMLQFLASLCMDTFNRLPDFELSDYTDMDVARSMNIVEEFLSEYSPELYDNFLNVRSTHGVKYYHYDSLEEELDYIIELHDKGLIEEIKYKELRAYYKDLHDSKFVGGSEVGRDGNATIVLEGMSCDMFYIAHEHMHMIFMHRGGTINDIFLREFPSIAIEFALSNYLIKHGMQDEANSYMQWRFELFKNNSSVVLFLWLLVLIYKKCHTLNSELVDTIINSLDDKIGEDFKENKDEYIKYISEQGVNQCLGIASYVLGVLIACREYDKIVNSADLLFKVGREINENDLYSSLEKLDVNYMKSVLHSFFKLFKREYVMIDEEKASEMCDACIRVCEMFQSQPKSFEEGKEKVLV